MGCDYYYTCINGDSSYSQYIELVRSEILRSLGVPAPLYAPLLSEGPASYTSAIADAEQWAWTTGSE